MQNKKAQGLPVSTIILIVLGLIVMVVLILGFILGWGNIKDWIIPSNNVKTIADSCKIACGTSQTYSYCFEKRELKTKEETLKDVTCYSLVKKKPGYGIETCPIDCGIYDSAEDARTRCPDKNLEVSYIDDASAAVMTKKCSDI